MNRQVGAQANGWQRRGLLEANCFLSLRPSAQRLGGKVCGGIDYGNLQELLYGLGGSLEPVHLAVGKMPEGVVEAQRRRQVPVARRVADHLENSFAVVGRAPIG